MPNAATTRVAAAAAVCLLLAAGCGGGTKNKSNLGATDTPSSASTANPSATASSKGAASTKGAVSVRVFRPGSTTQSKFHSSVHARAGQLLQVLTTVPHPAAAGRIEISLAKGPATDLSVRVTGLGSGGAKRASIRSGNGSAIELQAPRYTCQISQTSFCRDDRGRESASEFTLSFPPTKATQFVVIAANVVAGG